MKLPDIICIAIAESSPIVRNGLTVLLRRLPDVHVQITEITSKEALQHCMEGHQPHLLVINPQFEDGLILMLLRKLILLLKQSL